MVKYLYPNQICELFLISMVSINVLKTCSKASVLKFLISMNYSGVSMEVYVDFISVS